MRKLTFILLCLIATCTFAQEKAKTPDLQTIDDGFFDPTRKPDKQKEVYNFHVDYRLEVGYNQADQRMMNDTNSVGYLHGARLGATFTFALPMHFSLQTGVLYTLSYGSNQQHWRSMTQQSAQVEYLQHRVLQHNITIPLRAYYTIPLWRELNLFFYAGPQLHWTVGETDYVKQHLSPATLAWLETQPNVHTSKYDQVWSGEHYHTNIQMGLGGGMEWDRYRLQAGYDFGLNNRIKNQFVSSRKMWEWSWYISFSYRL